MGGNMDKDVVVLAIHGMGSQGPEFARDMFDEVQNRIEKAGKDPNKVVWDSIYWANIVEPKQLSYFNEARRRNDLDYIKLRKFMLTAFGDASAYRQIPGQNNDVYERIHNLISEKISSIYQYELGSKPKPIIILAHSLGGHIISNFIWDMHKVGGNDLSPFEKMKYVTGIVTFGCNIPLFTFAYDKVVPIHFPHPSLPDKYKEKSKWLNYFDPDDVLGYPLKPLNKEYSKVVNQDIEINAGGILTSWNPMSHSGYWTDDDFTKPVTRLINSFLS
jgi:hypothetical protein